MTSRRGYLAVLGTATVLAGCSGTEEVSDPVESPNNTTGENESTNDTSTPNETAGDSPDNDNTSTTNETVEDQPEDDDTESSISFDTAEWLDEGSIVELIVANQDDVAIQQLEIIVDWYYENGNFVGWDSQRVPALGAGKSWYLHVERSTNQLADSFEATAEGIRQERQMPDDLSIQSVDVDEVGDIRGILSNGRSSEIAVNMIGTVYDSGWLTNTGGTTQTRIPAGADWQFQFETRFVDADATSPGDEIELFVTSR